MASRRQKRQKKSKAVGEVKPLHKRFSKEAQMNDGGFYEGMPGCTLDENGNRKMINFVTTPDGDTTSQIYAHPKFVKACIQGAMTNPMIKGIINSAVLDQVFSKPTVWNWLLRKRLLLNLKRYHKQMEKKVQKAKEDAKMEAET